MKRLHLQDRNYRLPMFRSFLLFFFIALWWLFCAAAFGGRGRETFDQKPVLCTYAPIEQYKQCISYVIKSGDTFLGILSRFGVSYDRAIACSRGLAPLGLPLLAPGDSMVLTQDDKGSAVGFSLLHRLECWYTVNLREPILRIEKKAADQSVHRCLLRGVLTTSLSENMNEMGVDESCVAKFADIFAWDINFFVDPQVNDSFEIIFDKKYSAGRFMGYGDILAAKYITKGRVFEAIGIGNAQGALRYYDPEGKSLQKQFLKAPLRFTHISSRFSLHRMHPVLGIVRPHLGIDYAAPVGTPVYAAADGIIGFAGFNGGFGNFIRIRHGASYETSYGHLRSFARSIRVGARVSQGELIGTVGQTGMATGPHLDYRMTIGQRFVNPMTIALPREKSIPPEEAQTFEGIRRECATMLTDRLPGKTGCYILAIERLEAHAAPAKPSIR
ncbi:MAG TPA: peptidoglycan DD-metalloendopeptidase family protein [Chitinivibrionales bacterium]